jgi:hypothetical protein
VKSITILYLILTIVFLAGCSSPFPISSSIHTDNLFSFSDTYGSLGNFVESMEADGLCKNPYQIGYPRLEDDQWVFMYRDGVKAWTFKQSYVHLINEYKYFTISNPESDWFFQTQNGALILLVFADRPAEGQDSLADCLEQYQTKTGLYMSLLYSPSTNDFLYTQCELNSYAKYQTRGHWPLWPESNSCRDLVRGVPSLTFKRPAYLYHVGIFNTLPDEILFPSDWIDFPSVCKNVAFAGLDYLSYKLPHGDGTEYIWGKSSCMELSSRHTFK